MAEEKNTYKDTEIESEIDDLKMELEHFQTKVNHFKFWILSSIEWRI